MEELIEKIKLAYHPLESVTHNTEDASVFIDCGPKGERLDHYTCGDEDCSCEEKEGWCKDAWEVDCVRPLEEEFEEWKAKNLSPNDEFTLTCSVCEKGGFYISIKQTGGESASKRLKTE